MSKTGAVIVSLVVMSCLSLFVARSEPVRAQGGNNVELIGQLGGETKAVFIEGNYAYLGKGPRLLILDISNPTNLTVIGKTPVLPGVIQDVTVNGNYAYIAADNGGLQIINISNLTTPTIIGSYDTPDRAYGVSVSGNYAYIADYNSGLQIIDISNPTNPVQTGSYDMTSLVWDVAVSGNYAYVANYGNGLQIINISNPYNPIWTGLYDTSGYSQGITVNGNYAYIADRDGGLKIIDISNPSIPILIGSYDTNRYAYNVVVGGDYAYIAYGNYGGLLIIDISNPSSPTLVGSYNKVGGAMDIAVNGNHAYLAGGSGLYTLRVLDISNLTTPSLVGSYDSLEYARDVAINGSYAYIADGNKGLQVIDTSKPNDLSLVGTYNSSVLAAQLRGVAVSANYAYVADTRGLLIVNISNPNNPTVAPGISTPGSAYGVSVSGNYAYIADGSSGLQIVDISNPTNPLRIGSYDTPGFAYKVTTSANYAYIADGSSGLQIVDISNPTNPILQGSYDTPWSANDVVINGNYAYVADQGSLQIIDITAPANPTLQGSYDTPGSAYGVSVSGSYAYIADYNSGLQIVDISNPTNPTLQSSYNTPGGALNVAFSGGYVYVADENSGLFVLRHNESTLPPTPTNTATPLLTSTTTPTPMATSQAQLSVNPNEVTFSVPYGYSSPVESTIEIRNTGIGTLSWSISDNMSWASVGQTNGTGDTDVTLNIDLTGLSPGSYSGEITISASNAQDSPQIIPVSLTVKPATITTTPTPSTNPTSTPIPTSSASPQLKVIPDTLEFSVPYGYSRPVDDTIEIRNTGTGILSWSVSDNMSWASVNPSSGSGDADVTLTINLTGLAVGTYSGEITISAPNAGGSPKILPLTLIVKPSSVTGTPTPTATRPTITSTPTPTSSATPTISPTPTPTTTPQAGVPDIRLEPTNLTFDLTSQRSRSIAHMPVKTEPSSNTDLIVAEDDTLILDFNIPTPEISPVQESGTTYQRFALPEASFTDEVGRPQLPVLGRWLAIPPGRKATIQVISTSVITLEGYHIYPAQELPRDNSYDNPPFEIDTVFYQQDKFYPQNTAWLEPPNQLRGFEAASLWVYPFQYNPKTKQVRHYTHIRVKINFVSDGQLRSMDSRLRSPHFDDMYRDLMLNYDRIAPPLEQRRDSRQTGADMLIITAPEFEEAANTLAQWRNQRGIKTEVRTTNQTGQTASAIQDFIQSAYNSWSPAPSFVLLLGDAEFIPPDYRTRSDEGLIGTDLYYTTVDGDDYFPDLSLGRISVDTVPEANRVINNIINYERNPVTDVSFYNRIAVVAYFQDRDSKFNRKDGYADRRFLQTSEEIRSFLQAQGYQAQRIYVTQPDVNPTNYNNDYFSSGEPLPRDLLRSNGFTWDGDRTDITNAVNQGVFILNHRDHGFFGGWGDPLYLVNDVNNLNNGNKLPIVFSINCETGWFDNETDFSSHGNDEISFAEAWLRNPNGGAVGVIASTRVSLSGHNDALVKGFYDAIWPNFLPYSPSQGRFAIPQRRMGNVLNYGKLYYATQYSSRVHDDSRKKQFEKFSYFGDPAMQIWTAAPTLAQKSFTIYNDGNADLVVSEINKQNDSCWLDVDANLPLTIAPGGSSEVTLTVSGNCASGGNNQEQLLVISNDPDESPYPSGVNISMTVPELNDVGFDSYDVGRDSGNNDGIINPGETVDIYIGLRNWGNDTATGVTAILTSDSPYVNITDNTAFYGVVGQETADSDQNDTFGFIISPDAPAQTVINFTVTMTDGAGNTWQDTFAFIVQPDTTPPNEPSAPTPADDVSDQPTNLTLRWQGGDPDGDSVTYDVYVDTEHPFRDLAAEQIGCSDIAFAQCDLSGLQSDTTYFWYVIATDQHGAETSSPVWLFRTENRQNTYLPLIVK